MSNRWDDEPDRQARYDRAKARWLKHQEMICLGKALAQAASYVLTFERGECYQCFREHAPDDNNAWYPGCGWSFWEIIQ